MKVTVLDSTKMPPKNPAICGGTFYKITGNKPNTFGSCKPGDVVLAIMGAEKIQYFHEEGIMHSTFEHLNSTYYFEEFNGVLQIKCP